MGPPVKRPVLAVYSSRTVYIWEKLAVVSLSISISKFSYAPLQARMTWNVSLKHPQKSILSNLVQNMVFDCCKQSIKRLLYLSIHPGLYILRTKNWFYYCVWINTRTGRQRTISLVLNKQTKSSLNYISLWISYNKLFIQQNMYQYIFVCNIVNLIKCIVCE